eukprot:scaffold1378_cov149-Skeletonema_dohrnii-CCMP3373.AAC.13
MEWYTITLGWNGTRDNVVAVAHPSKAFFMTFVFKFKSCTRNIFIYFEGRGHYLFASLSPFWRNCCDSIESKRYPGRIEIIACIQNRAAVQIADHISLYQPNDISSRQMISSVPFLCLMLLLGLDAVSPSATSDGTVNQLGVASASYLRGSLGEGSNNAIVPARSTLDTPPSPRLLSIIKYHGADVTEDSTSITIPLRVFLSNTPRILEDVSKFEQAVVDFISVNSNEASLLKDGVVRFISASVLDQRLIWEEDTSSIGLEVHFQADASVPNDIHRNKLKKATQKLLYTRSDVFQAYLEKSPKGIAENDEAESVALTWSVPPPVGFATTAIGLCGIVASVGYLFWKMRTNQPAVREETKPAPQPTEINSKPTLETSESFANDSYLDHSLTFPMQYHESPAEEWDDVSGPDDITDDGSFNASVAFCPSVLQRGHELSAFRANIADNTDSDSEDEEDDVDASVGKFRSPPLSPEALQEFDMALRRAEF